MKIAIACLLAAMVLLDGCSSDQPSDNSILTMFGPTKGNLNHFDYQLGGAYRPSENVAVVIRDRTESIAIGKYNICYINGFQTQPNEANHNHWNDEYELKLKDEKGDFVVDEKWEEFVLDISTERKRKRLVEIVTLWIAKCAQDGFDAVEIDNMDTYLRTRLVKPEHNIEVMRDIIKVAKTYELEVAQKNALDIANSLETDFVIVEQCSKYDICDDYIDLFPNRTFIIEYEKQWFKKTCQNFGNTALVIYRDEKLKPTGHAEHIYQQCETNNPNPPL